MDALSLLKQDHAAMKKMLSELDSTTERAVKTREQMLAKMKQDLTMHERTGLPGKRPKPKGTMCSAGALNPRAGCGYGSYAAGLGAPRHCVDPDRVRRARRAVPSQRYSDAVAGPVHVVEADPLALAEPHNTIADTDRRESLSLRLGHGPALDHGRNRMVAIADHSTRRRAHL